MKPNRLLLKCSLLLSLTTLAGLVIQPPDAHACGGFFCTTQPIDQAAERILFAKDGDDMVAHVQIQYTGPAENFAWVVPAPTPPTLGIGSDELFNLLRNATRPTFQLDTSRAGVCKINPEPSAEATAEPSAAPSATPAPGVDIISQQQVGPFESAVIKSEDPQAMKTWLKDNGYQLPDNLDPLLDPYVNQGFYFLALKLKKDASTGDLQPITMRFKGDKPMIPIRLTAVAATPNMDIQVWLLGQHRGVPVNYRHVEINPTRLNWGNNGSNYRQLVIDSMDEAGGRAFVTEYAGDSTQVNLDSLNTQQFNLAALLEATEPLDFAAQVRQQRFFINSNSFTQVQAQEQAFLKRYIPKPASIAEISDDFFYTNLEQFADLLKKEQVTVDTNKALQEIRERILTPYQEIQNLFRTYPYLTAMYTTLSPEEMTLDPGFDFNADLPKVSNQFAAKAIQVCRPDTDVFDAPYQIQIDGKPELNYEIKRLGGDLSNTPAALRITQLSGSGSGDAVKDNQAEIIRTAQASLKTTPQNGQNQDVPVAPSASPESGFNSPPQTETGSGCACHSPNDPPPLSQGSGEGATYAMLGLGFLAWRKRNKR